MNPSTATFGSAEATTSVLRTRGLTLGYERPDGLRVLLEAFDLDIEPGELVALLGPSGVGKSSLLRVLAGLQQPLAGRVSAFGAPLAEPHPRLAFVFQQAALLPWLSVRENVAFGLDFKHQPKLAREALQARVDAALAEVGLSTAAAMSPAELSGGMAQRVSLARALAREPAALLLDEPFSALDEVTRSEMQTLLRTLVTRHRSAAVLVTHDIDEALTVADRVLLIGGQPGRLLGEWKPSLPFPREDVALKLNDLRLQILRTLHSARAPQAEFDYTI